MSQVFPSTGQTIDHYVPLVEFLGTFLGEKCEVVLHDMSSRERSVVAIANGHISGRKKGAPLTDLALQFYKDREHENRDWVMGYTTRSAEGVPLNSATYFIRNGAGELMGMLCLNLDLSVLLTARDSLDTVLKTLGASFAQPKGAPALTENFPLSIEDLTENMICQVIQEADVPPDRMTPAEKQEVVTILNARGAFLLKGTVRVVAEKLVSSEATVYRYLQKSNRE
ncbi:MAG: PAS domain-containing protein [Desulfobacterium sp.]|nr:PAS domain-containing protein [Desulfobacterium sp.]